MYYSITFPGKVISHILQSGVILHDRRYTVGEYKDTQDSYFRWVILDWHRHGDFECQSESPDDIAMDFIELVGAKRAFIAVQKALD